MAKVKGPLFSVSASGDFKGIMEFRTGGGRTIVHGSRQAPSTRSPAQQAMQARFAEAVQGWKTLSQAQKALWTASASGTLLNGYQLYLSEYQTQNIHAPAQPIPP